MRFVDEYRAPGAVRSYLEQIALTVTRPWTIMEVCGGQTHSIVKHGLDELLPSAVTLVHGPGCPVCVTPLEQIEKALAVSMMPGVTLCSYGDMLRVPGARHDLLWARSCGADVRIVYSPLDAVELAKRLPERQVVFFAVGFETTAPANAMAAWMAKREGIANFSMLVSHVLVPPAIRAVMASPSCRVQGFLAAGHVCAVMGTGEYEPLVRDVRVPIVVTGFEPLDIVQGIYLCVKQLEAGQYEVQNQYSRAVRAEGNQPARQAIEAAFHVVDRKWRGIGLIPMSGLALRPEFAALDAERRFDLAGMDQDEPSECHSGLVLQGLERPSECPWFGRECTPEHPKGATMVSSEGACAAYYRYRRHTPGEEDAR